MTENLERDVHERPGHEQVKLLPCTAQTWNVQDLILDGYVNVHVI